MDKRQIVIVEDDNANSRLIQKMLQYEGHEVYVTRDGVTGFACIQEISPDLIVTDLRLPGLSGWELIEQVRSNPATAQIPIVAVSAPSGIEDIQRAYDAGCNMFVSKPFAVSHLYGEISQILGLNRVV